MKGFKRFIGLACLIVFVGLMTFGGGPVQSAEFTLRYAGNLPLTHHVTRGQELLANLIEQQTSSRVKVLVYPAGQLFADKDMMKALPSGAVEMGTVTLSQWSGVVPGLMLLDLPFFFNDRHQVWRAVDGEAGEILKKEFEKVGIKLLYYMDWGSVDLISKEPIRTLEDFKGKRLRVYGELLAEWLKAFGAAPTFLGGGEIYMALQRGTVDGAITGNTNSWERKFYEVAKYITHVEHSFATFGVLMNLKKWNELPPDIQKVFLDCSKEAQEWGRKEAEKADREVIGLLKTKGVEVYTVPEKEKERWRKVAIKPSIDVFLKRTGEKGKVLLEMTEKMMH